MKQVKKTTKTVMPSDYLVVVYMTIPAGEFKRRNYHKVQKLFINSNERSKLDNIAYECQQLAKTCLTDTFCLPESAVSVATDFIYTADSPDVKVFVISKELDRPHRFFFAEYHIVDGLKRLIANELQSNELQSSDTQISDVQTNNNSK